MPKGVITMLLQMHKRNSHPFVDRAIKPREFNVSALPTENENSSVVLITGLISRLMG